MAGELEPGVQCEAVRAALDEIHQGTRAEIEQQGLIGFNQIAGGGSAGMDIRPGTQDGQIDHRRGCCSKLSRILTSSPCNWSASFSVNARSKNGRMKPTWAANVFRNR